MGVHKDFIRVLLTDLKCEKSVCVWGGGSDLVWVLVGDFGQKQGFYMGSNAG
jgi:hypothetical protein